jgi:GH15 family glucan-1,4-alpha-glucosidase
VVSFVTDHWREPDDGIWETRAGPQHFVYSKVMC